MEVLDAYKEPLRAFMSSDFRATRKALGLSQFKMAELLEIDLRSYADLEHGKSLCCTRVLFLYLNRCGKDRIQFLDEVDRIMRAAETEQAS